MAHHLYGRRFNVRVIAQEGRTFRVGRKDNRISVRQFVIHRREALATPARTRTKPGRHNGDRQLFRDVRRRRKHHRQGERTVIPRIKERNRESREIVFQRQRLVGHLQRGVTPDVHPQRVAGRVFADIAVVTDKLQADTVKVGDEQWVDWHLSLRFLTQLLFRDRQNVHQLIIQVDLQLRLRRQQ